jgi:hypothetical protein
MPATGGQPSLKPRLPAVTEQTVISVRVARALSRAYEFFRTVRRHCRNLLAGALLWSYDRGGRQP